MAWAYFLVVGLLVFASGLSHIVDANGSHTAGPGITYLSNNQVHNTTAPVTQQTPITEPGKGSDGKNNTGTGKPEGGKGEPEDSRPEPEGDAEPEAEAEAEDSFAEPGPEWEEAKREWQAAWELHVYIFGGLFTVLGVYCLVSVVRLWKMNHLLSRHYFLSLNVLNVIVCLLRALYLFIDAYNSHGTFPAILDYFLYSTVFPCLTALFSVLFYALLLATRMRIMSQKVQRLRVLIGIIVFHFLLSFITDIVVGLSSSAAVLIFICQVFYVIWGLLMFIGYFIIFKRMYNGIMKKESTRRKTRQHQLTTITDCNVNVPKSRHTIGLAVKITLASALFGVACIGFQLFGMFGVYGTIGDYGTPNPWSWWVYHTGMRLLEVLMCFCIAIVSLQPLKHSYKDQRHQTLFCLMPCCLSCYHIKLDELDSSYSIEPSVAASETKKLEVVKSVVN